MKINYLDLNKNIVSKIQRKAKRVTIKKITNDVNILKGQAPVLQTLVQYGKAQALPQIINTPKEKPKQDYLQKNLQNQNSLAKMILSSENKDPIELISQQISFQKYKSYPYSDKYLQKSKSKQKNSPHKQEKKSRLKINKSRVLTMPSQLQLLKQELKQLPIVGLSPKKSKQSILIRSKRNKTNPSEVKNDSLSVTDSGIRYSRQKLYQSISLDEIQLNLNKKNRFSDGYHSNHLNSNTNKINFTVKNSSNIPKGIFVKDFRQKRQSYLQNIRSILDRSKDDLNPVRKFISQKDIQKLKKSQQKLKRFLDYEDPPSQILMNLMEEIEQIQNQEDIVMKNEVRRQAKDSLGNKFKSSLQNQNDMHKKRLKRFIDDKKRFKIDMVKLQSLKISNGKKQKGINKILQTEENKNENDAQNTNNFQLKKKYQINCERCQVPKG